MTKAASWRHCLSSHWSRHWIKFYFSKRQQNELIGNLCVFIKLLFCFLHGPENTVQLTFSNQLLCKCERQTFWCQKMLHLINADILIRPDGAFGKNKLPRVESSFWGLMSTKFPVIQTNWSHWSSFPVAQGCHRYFSEKLFVPKSIIFSTKSRLGICPNFNII